MKKYLLGFFAIILAVSLSAFSAGRKHTPTSKPMDGFFWYRVSSLGITLHSSPVFDGNSETQQYAENNNDCTPGNNADCIRGYASPLSSDDAGPGDAVPIRRQ